MKSVADIENSHSPPRRSTPEGHAITLATFSYRKLCHCDISTDAGDLEGHGHRGPFRSLADKLMEKDEQLPRRDRQRLILGQGQHLFQVGRRPRIVIQFSI